MDLSSPSVLDLNEEQVQKYFERINLPTSLRVAPPLTLHTLTKIQQYHISNIPFENVELHYSMHRAISVDPQSVFHKLVTRRRGGYCMEQNCLMEQVLKQLGFQVYLTGCRTQRRTPEAKPTGVWFGLAHNVAIVTLASENGAKYAVDVGYGGDGPPVPMPLIHNHAVPSLIGRQELRLSYRTLGEEFASNPSEMRWVYETRHGPDEDWNTNYTFSETAYILQDFEVMNHWTSTSPRCFMTVLVVAHKQLMDENGKLTGKVSIRGSELKELKAGDSKPRLIKEFKIEKERVEALKEYFGIELSIEEQAAINWRVSALPWV